MLIAAVGVLLASLPRLKRQWFTDRSAALRTAAVLLLFIAYMGIGGYLLITSFPGFDLDRPLALLGFAGTAIGWIALGSLMVLGMKPYPQGLPRWVVVFGILDALVLLLLFGGLFALHRY